MEIHQYLLPEFETQIKNGIWAGTYIIKDVNENKIVYIGQSIYSVKKRLDSHWNSKLFEYDQNKAKREYEIIFIKYPEIYQNNKEFSEYIEYCCLRLYINFLRSKLDTETKVCPELNIDFKEPKINLEYEKQFQGIKHELITKCTGKIKFS